MTIAIVSIGTELTRGEIINSNAAWLGERSAELGHVVVAHETIPDEFPAIIETLRRLCTRADFVLCTGGLGPTTDDLTSAAVAETLGMPLVRSESSADHIRAIYAAYGRAVTESNLKQADFPQNADVLPNELGTAPGFSVKMGSCRAFFFPGVPREMKGIFERSVAPMLQRSAASYTHVERLQMTGAPESKVNDTLQGLEAQYNVTIGYRVHFPCLELKALATDAHRGEAERRAKAAATAMEERLGSLVFARGRQSLPETVGGLLRARNLMLGLGESCTGGLLASLISATPCSDFFRGAVVTYADEVKVSTLGVRAETLKAHGAVSEAVVLEMARGTRRALNADVAISLSGIAGPTGGSEEKPVGLVHWAVITPTEERAYSNVFRGDRGMIQRWAAFAALDSLRRLLLDSDAGL